MTILVPFIFEYNPWECVSWCKMNNLILNISKTKEMAFDFSTSQNVTLPVFINGAEIEKVFDFKYLGTFFSEYLRWHSNSDSLYKKIKSLFTLFLNSSLSI